MDPFQLAEKKLKHWSLLDAKTGKTLQSGLTLIRTDIRFEANIQLNPIDDSAHAFVPKDPNCKVKQTAVLRKHPLPGEKRILVEEQIWKSMSSFQKTALILHETIYECLAELGEKDSRKTRFLVSEVMSSDFETMDSVVYWNLIHKLRLPIYP